MLIYCLMEELEHVKASDENNLDLGDKQNEAVRVDASELKAKNCL